MRSDNYDALYHILLGLSEKRNEIQGKADKKLSEIQEMDYYISHYTGNAENDFKVFSPRDGENLHKDEIEKARIKKTELQKLLDPLSAELERMDSYMDQIKDILRSEEKEEDDKDTETAEEEAEPADTFDKDFSILKIQEEDRQRIARDLHDTVLQDIAHLIHKVELSTIFIDQDPVRAKLEMSVIKKDLKKSVDEIRNVVFDLRPMTFDDLGLQSAFEALFQMINPDMRYHIDLQIENVSCETQDKLFMINIYRIVQECVYNIVKHAEADRILFRFLSRDNSIRMDIEDNGKGFALEETEKEQNKHFGLSIVQERIKILGGKIQILSEIGKGTKIHMEIPY